MHRAGRLVLDSLNRFVEMSAPLVYQPGTLLRKRLATKQKEQVDPKLEPLLNAMKPIRKQSAGKTRERPLRSREKRDTKPKEPLHCKELEELLNRVRQ